MSTFRYVVGVLLVVGLPPGVLWWFVVHPFVGFWRRLGPRLSLWILGPLLVLGALALVPVRDALLGRDLGLRWPAFGAGVALAVVSGAMALARRRHLTLRILAGVPELQEDGRGGTLLTEGPYGLVRHPRYVEVWLGSLAYALMADYMGGYVLMALMLPALHLLVVVEERELAERFGEAWADYAARVPRYVPRWGR